MKLVKYWTYGLFFYLLSVAAYADCPDGEVKFSFRNLDARAAFALLADFAGLQADIDQSIKASGPINFDCTPWRVAAENLAGEYHLKLRIENGVMHVTK